MNEFNWIAESNNHSFRKQALKAKEEYEKKTKNIEFVPVRVDKKTVKYIKK